MSLVPDLVRLLSSQVSARDAIYLSSSCFRFRRIISPLFEELRHVCVTRGIPPSVVKLSTVSICEALFLAKRALLRKLPIAKVLYPYQGADEGELTANEGDTLVIEKMDDSGWHLCRPPSAPAHSAKAFPSNFFMIQQNVLYDSWQIEEHEVPPKEGVATFQQPEG